MLLLPGPTGIGPMNTPHLVQLNIQVIWSKEYTDPFRRLCVKQNVFEWPLEKKSVYYFGIYEDWSLNCTRITIIAIIHFAGRGRLMHNGARIDSIAIIIYNVCILWWKHNSYELTSLHIPVRRGCEGWLVPLL